MNARQICYRVFYAIRKRIGYRLAKKIVGYEVRRVPFYYEKDIFDEAECCEQGIVKEADEIIINKFKTVANITLSFEEEIDWNIEGLDYRLVCFRLNSFRFLLTLSDAYKISGKKEYIDYGFSLIDDWISRCCDNISGDKWNPYVIGERLTHWIGFCSQYSNEDIKLYAEKIYQNTVQLSKTIEYQIDGNHLLSEGKALMLSGIFLKDDEIYRKGKRILISEFDRQFLSDGGNYERSISYHIEALQQYFEASMLMHNIGDKDFKAFRVKLIKPYVFLNSMFGADRSIPLVNDSAYDYPFDAADFLNTAGILFGASVPNARAGSYSKRWRSVENDHIDICWNDDSFHKSTGFLMEKYRVNDEEYSFFFDVGEVGANNIPAHVHADSLNVLWSAKGKPVFVDSGVYTYKPGEDRNACRGTAAHNTIEIDNTNSSEIWSAFRVGKRARTVVKSYVNTEDYLEISACHDGYNKMLKKPVTHTRRVSLNKDTGEICIDDLLDGRGVHKGILRFHVSPDCNVEKVNRDTVLIDGIYSFKCSEGIIIEDCKIAEFFGKSRYGKCVRADFAIDGKKIIQSRLTVNREERM